MLSGDQFRHTGERDKWNRYYESLPLTGEEESGNLLEREIVNVVSELLPQGGRVLEAGCGGGFQSLALARTGRFEVTVLDFAENALDYARRVFEQAGVAARYVLADAANPGEPEFDLVFNAGVLEHYTFEEQTAILNGMRSRSRGFVLALVPNAACYWYWIWRLHHAARGGWPFGKEVAQVDLLRACQAAGLQPLGFRFLAQAWTEQFVASLAGLDAALREQILRIHRSPLIPAAQKSYLAATLASVKPRGRIAGWSVSAERATEPAAETGHALAAALCDSLASIIAYENRLTAVEGKLDSDLAAVREMARHAIAAKELALATQAAENASKELTLAERVRQIALLNDEAARSKRQIESQLEALRRVEELRSRAAYGVKEYETRLLQELDTIRSQRAWTAMLIIRKAYALLFRGGLASKLAFLKFALAWPFASRADLEPYEPRFPDLAPYLPEDLRRPIEGAFDSRAPNAGAAPAAHDFSLPAGARAQTAYDVIVLAIVDFDFRFQRPQQIAAQFARTGHRVFWISPTRFLPPSSAEPYRILPLRENLWEIHLRGPQPDIYLGRLEPAVAETLEAALDGVYRDLAIAESCVLAQLPFWRQLALAARDRHASKLVYDCMDDWETFENMGAFNVEEEKRLVHECDLLIATAQKLADKFAAQGLHPLLARNGADFEFFTAGSSGATPAGALGKALQSIPRPVVGYFGAIADWIDLDLIYETARLRPAYSFVLVGQVFNRDVSKLTALPNVFLMGNQPYSEIPACLRAFDACTIPFLLNQVTHATDPVKLYEYFTLGKPVVATGMAELAQCGDLLYIARGAADFAAKLDAALSPADGEKREARIAFASRNTWAQRIEAIDSALRPLFPLVSIVIVTYNSAEFIGPCLESILRNTSYPRYEVVIVDNCSADATAAVVDSYARDAPIRLKRLAGNRGFAAGNNIGVEMAGGEFIVLLNADTLATSGWIERLLRSLRRDARLGLVCPVTNFAGNEAKISVDYAGQSEMERFALRLAVARRGEEWELSVAPLFCAMFRRELWNAIGPLDEEFQIGMFEDDDFSERVRQAGFRIAAVEDCFIHHFGQGSFAKLPSEEYNRLFEQNRLRFERKWKTKWTPHKTRPAVKPAHRDRRFEPREFVRSPGAG